MHVDLVTKAKVKRNLEKINICFVHTLTLRPFFFIHVYIEAPYRQNILQGKPLFYLNKLKNDAAWQSNVKQ